MSSPDVGSRRALPEHIGRYRVVERIGQGAMGVVYRAQDEAMGREVAIKLLLADLENEPEIRARFLREAEAAAKLSHPNIITIYDVDEEHGRVFMVMELLRGATLKDFLARSEAAPIERRLDLMIQLGAGLGAAHNAGIIHRDIKPGNLFVRTDGILKILDFGVARLASSSMTAAGFVVGTPDFMSPEQVRGLPIDGRSDIFSAGGVFYYMVTGRKPFAAANLPAIFRMVLQEDPPAPQPSEAPPDLARIIMKALAKDRDLRYQSCQELLADLYEVRRRFPSVRRAGAPARSAAVSGSRAPAADPTPPSTPPPAALDIDRTTMTPRPMEGAGQLQQPRAAEGAGTPAPVPISTSEATIAAPAAAPGNPSDPAARSDVVEAADDSPGSPPPAFAGAGDAWPPAPDAARRASPSRQPSPATVRPPGGAPTSAAPSSASADGNVVPTFPTSPQPAAAGAAGAAAADTPAALSAPTISPGPPARKPATRRSRAVVWGGAAAAVLVLAVGSTVVLRNRRTAPPVGAPAAREAASPAAPAPQPAVQPSTTDQQVAQQLAEARAAIDRQDFAGALDDLRPVLDRDPQHAEAASLRKQAEDALARPAAPPAGERPRPRAPDEPAAAGIQRLPNESPRQYEDRLKRVKARYAEGRLALERRQFGAAIASFQAVDRDQPNYLDVRSLLADAVAARNAAFREAMDQGARAEGAEQWKAALEAYLRAEQYDTGSAAAEKARTIRERLVRDATAALQRAHTYQAMRKPAEAVRLYQQVVDSLPEGHALRDQALQRMRALKP